MSTKVLMPSDKVRVSSNTYRDYALSYKEFANLMRKTSEDTSKIVPVPSTAWRGVAAERFTAMMTQVVGASATAADTASLIAAYYDNLAESAAQANYILQALSARFRVCESQIKDAEKHSGGFSLSGAIDFLDDSFSKSPDEIRSTQRQIAAAMADVHADWQRMDAAMSADIRNRFLPAMQAALDMLPFKFRSSPKAMPATPTPSRPQGIPGSIRAAEAAEEIRNRRSQGGTGSTTVASGLPGSIRAAEERERIRQERENSNGASAPSSGVSQPGSPGSSNSSSGSSTTTGGSSSGTNQTPPAPSERALAGVPEITPGSSVVTGPEGTPTTYVPGRWPVMRGDSWWKIAETTLRSEFHIEPTPSQINTYIRELRAANPEAATRPLIQGVTTISTVAPSWIPTVSSSPAASANPNDYVPDNVGTSSPTTTMTATESESAAAVDLGQPTSTTVPGGFSAPRR